jgi:hypothetical protein
MHSTDAGLSWRWTDQAPLLLMVAFGDGATVAGLTPDGQVHTSTDAGRTWRATELLAPDAQSTARIWRGRAAGDPQWPRGQSLMASTGDKPFAVLMSGLQ